MSRSPKDKPAEEVYVPTTVTSRRPGRTKLRPVDHPRYIMPLSEASNPYKGQSGNGVVGRLGRTIVGRKKGLLSFLLRTVNTNRIKKIDFPNKHRHKNIFISRNIYLRYGLTYFPRSTRNRNHKYRYIITRCWIQRNNAMQYTYDRLTRR